MDIGHLTDLLPYAFSMAANASDVISPPIINAVQDVWTGVSQPEAMTASDKTMQFAKIGVATLGLSASLTTFSIEGIAACCLMEGEAFMEIGKRGHAWRMAHQPPAFKPDW